MGSFWTVAPEVERYTLNFREREFWIDLKKELTNGERNKIRTSAIRSYSRRAGVNELDAVTVSDLEMNVDLDAALYEKVRVWLADWSLTDDNGNKLTRSLDTFRALRGGVFDLIEKKVDDHAKAVEDHEKKVLPTPTPIAAVAPKKISAS